MEITTSQKKIKVAIIGPGNIGMDLMYKLRNRSKYMTLNLLVGRNKESKGILLAQKEGYDTSTRGVDAILERPDIKIVFDATTAEAHKENAPFLREAGKVAIDLTPAAVGPYVLPVVNLEKNLDSPNINLITCGGQATIPMVYAVSRVVPVEYGEIVATIASKSAGIGTRESIDEFTVTTAKGIRILGGAKRSKAIILLNPAEPPIIMTNTIYCIAERIDKEAIINSVNDMVKQLQGFVPGYRLKVPPVFDGNRVTTMVEVVGAGDYLPTYSGNLDIETSAAIAVGERIAKNMLDKEMGV
jgi:acetaldehyde dehydrogenase (acetylating)